MPSVPQIDNWDGENTRITIPINWPCLVFTRLGSVRFPNLKNWLAGIKLSSNTEINEVLNEYFEGVNDFLFFEGFRGIEKHWTQFVKLKRHYVEKWIQFSTRTRSILVNNYFVKFSSFWYLTLSPYFCHNTYKFLIFLK